MTGIKGIFHPDTGTGLEKAEYEAVDGHDLTHGTTLPETPTERDLFFHDTEKTQYQQSNSQWRRLNGFLQRVVYIPAASFLPSLSTGHIPSWNMIDFLLFTLDFISTDYMDAYLNSRFPVDFVPGNVAANLYWTSLSTTGDVKFTLAILRRQAGELVNGIEDQLLEILCPAPGTSYALRVCSLGYFTNIDQANLCLLRLRRDGAHADDTMTEDAKILGLEFVFDSID